MRVNQVFRLFADFKDYHRALLANLQTQLTFDIKKHFAAQLYGKVKDERKRHVIRDQSGLMVTLPGVKNPIPLVACSVPDCLSILNEIEHHGLKVSE